MVDKLVDLLATHRIVSIVGMCKNAGKTTVLNELIASYNRLGVSLGITSIGLDGEDVDLVTGTDKPRVHVLRGTLIATAQELLLKSDFTREILQTTGFNTPLGEVVLARARSDGHALIGGSAINSQIAIVCAQLKEFGAEKILIDGAINRKAVSGPGVTEAVVLCSGASLHPDMTAVVRETCRAVALLSLKPHGDDRLEEIIAGLPEDAGRMIVVTADYSCYSFDAANRSDAIHRPNSSEQISYIVLRGAVTDRRIDNLIAANIDLTSSKIVAEDGSKILLSEDSLTKLQRRGWQLTVSRAINLVALTLNPVSVSGYAFDRTQFIEAMQKQVALPVFDVLYEEGVEPL